jgi:hypothetical protein
MSKYSERPAANVLRERLLGLNKRFLKDYPKAGPLDVIYAYSAILHGLAHDAYDGGRMRSPPLRPNVGKATVVVNERPDGSVDLVLSPPETRKRGSK